MQKDNKDLRCVSFDWVRASSSLYDLQQHRFTYKAGGTLQYRPVVGSIAFKPNTGRYFFQYDVNCDNTRVGFCTASVDLEGELGKTEHALTVNLQTGSVEVNGTEVKKLWRLLVPVSGGACGFVVDTNQGLIQFYFNGEFQGTMVNDTILQSDAWKDAALYPCVGVAGLEAHNRNIGVGMKGAVVTENPVPYRTLVS